MVKIGEVACPKCGEDQEDLVTPVIDPMGKRWFCSVCAHEFRVASTGGMVMKCALLSLMAVAALGCSSMTERIVKEARTGLVWSADYNPKEGGDPKALAALYEHLTVNLLIDVQYVPAETLPNGAFGISYVAGQHAFIRLRQDLSVNGSIEVLAHEAAHIMQPPHLSRSEQDVFAEVVSAHVAKKLGVPHTIETAALWLRQHKASLRTALALQKEILHVAKMLTPRKGSELSDTP